MDCDSRTVYLGSRWRDASLRIGDLAALMIYGQYLTMWEGRRLAFELTHPTHKEMRLDRLFPHLVSEFLTDGTTGLPFHDPGPLWIVVPELVSKYGSCIIPVPRFEKALYAGPELPSSPFCVFSTCFDPPYNPSRGMSPSMVNSLLFDLSLRLEGRLVVITDSPHLITVPGVNIFPPSDIYTLLYVINSASVFIGGDTGFSHFAGLSRVPLLISLYGNNSYGVTAEYGEEWSARVWNSLPSTDVHQTSHHVHLMQANQLISLQRFAVVKAVLQALAIEPVV